MGLQFRHLCTVGHAPREAPGTCKLEQLWLSFGALIENESIALARRREEKTSMKNPNLNRWVRRKEMHMPHTRGVHYKKLNIKKIYTIGKEDCTIVVVKVISRINATRLELKAESQAFLIYL